MDLDDETGDDDFYFPTIPSFQISHGTRCDSGDGVKIWIHLYSRSDQKPGYLREYIEELYCPFLWGL